MNNRWAVLLFMSVCLASALLAGCASTHQITAIATGPIAADSARIIVSRDSEIHGSAVPFVIVDSGTQIGEIGPGGQLVWDRNAGPMQLTAFWPGLKGQPAPLQIGVAGGMSYQVRAYYPSTGGMPMLELLSGTPVPYKQNETTSSTGKEENVRPSSAEAVESHSPVPVATVKTVDGKFKAIEVKHFSQVDGLGRSQVFVNSFYDGLREGLTKLKIADQVVDEGALVTEADAANSVVVEGRFTEYKEGGFLAGPGKVGLEIKLSRKSDHALITTITPRVPFKSSPLNTDMIVGKVTGQRTAYEIKNALK